MSSAGQLRLRKQSRLLRGHCNEYLSRTAFWKHRQLYYDVHNECWTTKDDAEEFKREMKRAKRSPAEFPESPSNLFPSDSSGEEDLETAITREGMYRRTPGSGVKRNKCLPFWHLPKSKPKFPYFPSYFAWI